MKKYLLLLVFVVLLGCFLRFYQLTNNPPGLYLDEVAIGLDAYHILTTGKDQHGTPFPLAFESFGDYKMPVYIYLTALSMTILGKTELAIRFSSAILGTLTIVVIFFLMKELIRPDKKIGKHANLLALGSATLLAILPWHIHFSRGGFETTIALFFYCSGLLVGILYWKTKYMSYLFSAVMLFCLAMYSYHSYRVVVPLTIIVCLIVFIRKKIPRKHIFISLGSFFLLALPLFLFSFTSHGQERLMQTSAFAENISVPGLPQPLTNFGVFTNNYFSFFSLTYLFHYGDQINRHQVHQFGLLYLWQLPFILAGFYYLIKSKNQLLRFIILLLLLVGPIPAALARPSPHSLRFLIGAVPFTLITVLGLYQVSFLFKSKLKLFLSGIIIMMLLGLLYFCDFYFVHYPREAQLDWGGQCKAVANTISKHKSEYDVVIIDNNLTCIPEYFAFYIPEITVKFVIPAWSNEALVTDKKVLFVRPFYEGKMPGKLIDVVRLENLNKDIRAQFYSL